MVGSFQQRRCKWHFFVAFLLMWTRFVENISTSVSSTSLYGSLLSLNRSKTSVLSEVKPTLNSSANGASSTIINLFKFFNSSAKSVVLHKPSLSYSSQNSPSSRSLLYSTTSVLAHTQSSDVSVISTPIVTLPSSSGIVTSPILPSRPSSLEQKRNHSTFVVSTFQGISFTKGEQHSDDRRLNSSLFVNYSNVSSSIRYTTMSSATAYAVSSISTAAKSDYSESYNASEKIASSLTILSTSADRHIVPTQSTNTSNDGNLRTENYLSGTLAHDTTTLSDLQTKTVDDIALPINRSRTILKSSMTEAVQSVKNTLSTMYPIQNTKEYRSSFTSLLHTAPRPTSALSVQPMSRDESFGTITTQAVLSLTPSVHYNLEKSSTRTPMPWHNNSSTMSFDVNLSETSSAQQFGSINSTIQNGLVGATVTPRVSSSGQQSINETIAIRSVPLGASFSPAVSSNGQHNEIETTPISVWVSVTQRASSNVQWNINGTIERFATTVSSRSSGQRNMNETSTVHSVLAGASEIQTSSISGQHNWNEPSTSHVVPIGASYTPIASASDGQYNKNHTSATRSVPVMASVVLVSSNNARQRTVAIGSIPVEMSVTLIPNSSWQYNAGVSTTTHGVPSGASATLIANSTELHNMNGHSTILGASTALIASSSEQHNMNGTSATHIDAVGSSFTLIANSSEQLNPSTTKILQSDTSKLSASFSRGGKFKVNTSIPFIGTSSSVYHASNGQHDASATKKFHTLPLLPSSSSSEGLIERNNTRTKSTRTPTLETSWTAPSIVNYNQSLSKVFIRLTSLMSETIARKSDGYSLDTVKFLQSSRVISNSQNIWLTSVKVKTNLSQSTISLVENGSEVLSTEEFPTLSRMTLSYTPTPSLVHHSSSLSVAKFVTSPLLNKSSIATSKDSSKESRISNSPKSFSELTSSENIITESTSAPTWVIPSAIFTVSHSSVIAGNYGLPSTTVKPDVSRMSSSKRNSKMAGYSVIPIITPCYISYVITITQRIMESFSSVFVGNTSSPSLSSRTTVHHQQSEDRSSGLTLQPTPSTTRTVPYFTMESLSTSMFQTKSLSVLPEQDQSSLTLEVAPSVSSSALYNASAALRTTSNNLNTSVFKLNPSVPVSSLQSPVAAWSISENKSQSNLIITEHTRSTTALDTTPVMTSSIFHVSSFKPSTGEPQATANLTTSEKSFSSHIFSRVVSSIATSYGYNNSGQATVVTSQSRDTWPISSKGMNSSALHLTSVLPTFSVLNTSSANAKTSLKEKSLSTESIRSMQSSHLGITHTPSSSNITHTVTHRPEETPMSLLSSSSKASVVAISSLVRTTGVKLDNKTRNIAPTLVNSYHVASSYFRNGTSTWSIESQRRKSIPAVVSATTFISDTSTVKNANITSDSAFPVVSTSSKLMVDISNTKVPSFSSPKSSFFESAPSLQTSTVANPLSAQTAVQNFSAAESRAWLHSPTSLNPTLTVHANNSINKTVYGFTRVVASSKVLSFVNNTPMATKRLFSSQAVVTTSADRYLKESGSLEESTVIITSISNANPGQSSASDESSVYFLRNASVNFGTLSHTLMPVAVPSIIPANHSNPVSTFLDVRLNSKTSSSVGQRVSVAPSVNTSSLISTWIGDRHNSTSLTTSYNITSPSSASQSSANYSDTISPFFLLNTTLPSVTHIARRKRRDVQNSPLHSNSTSTGSVSDRFVSLSASVIAPTKPMTGTPEIVSLAATMTKDLLSSSTAVDLSVPKSVSLKPSSPTIGEEMSGTLITRTPSLGVSLLLETTDYISNTSTFQDSGTTKQSLLPSQFELKNSSYVADSTSDSPSANDRLLETSVSKFLELSSDSLPVSASKIVNGTAAFNRLSTSYISKFLTLSTGSLLTSATNTFSETVVVNKTSSSAVFNFSAHSTASFPASSSKTFSETVAVNKTSSSTASNFSVHSTSSLHAFSSTKTFRKTVAVNKTSSSAVSNSSAHSTASFPASSSKTFSETVAVNKTSSSTTSNFSVHSTGSLHAFSSTKTFRETVAVNKTSSSAVSNFSAHSTAYLPAFSSKTFSENVAVNKTSSSTDSNFSVHSTGSLHGVSSTKTSRETVAVNKTSSSAVSNFSKHSISSLQAFSSKIFSEIVASKSLLQVTSLSMPNHDGPNYSTHAILTSAMSSVQHDNTVSGRPSPTLQYTPSYNRVANHSQNRTTVSTQDITATTSLKFLVTKTPTASLTAVQLLPSGSAILSTKAGEGTSVGADTVLSTNLVMNKSHITTAVESNNSVAVTQMLSSTVTYFNEHNGTSTIPKPLVTSPFISSSQYLSPSAGVSVMPTFLSRSSSLDIHTYSFVSPQSNLSRNNFSKTWTLNNGMSFSSVRDISEKSVETSAVPFSRLDTMVPSLSTSVSLVPQASTEVISSEIWHSTKASSSFIETVSSKSSKHAENKSTAVVSSVTEPSLSQLSSSPMVTMSTVNNENSRKVNSSSPPFTYYIISTSSLGNCIVGYSTLRHPNVTVEASLSTIVPSSLHNVSSRDSLYSSPVLFSNTLLTSSILSSVTGNTSSFIVNMTVQPTSALLLKPSRPNASRVLVSTLSRLSTDFLSSVSRSLTSFSVLSVLPSPTLRPSSIHDLPSSPYWSTLTSGNSSISGVSSMTRESASISGVSSMRRARASISGISSVKRDSTSISGVLSVIRESASISEIPTINLITPSSSSLRPSTIPSSSVAVTSAPTSAVDEDALLLIVVEVSDTVDVTTNQFKNTMEEKLNVVYQNGRQVPGKRRKRRNTAVDSSVKVMDIKRSGKKVDVKYVVMEDNKTVSAVDAAKKMNVFSIQQLGTMIGYDVLLRPEPAPKDVTTDNIVAMLVKTSSQSNLSTPLVKQSFEGQLADFYKSSTKGQPLGQIIKATVTRVYFEPLARTYVEFVITVDNVTVNQSIVQNVFDSPTNVLTAKLKQVVLVAPYIPGLLKPTIMDYIIQTIRYTNKDDFKVMETELPTKLSRVYLAAKQKVSRKRRKRALGSIDTLITTIHPKTENFLVDVTYYITDGGSVLNATYACAILNRLTTNEMTQITTPFIVNTSPKPIQSNTSKRSDNDDHPPWLIIAILAGCVGLLLVIILIILYCRWKKGAPLKKINPGVTSPGEEQLPRPRMTYAADQNERPDLHRARPPPRTAVSVEENGQGPSGRPPLRKLPVRENSMRKKVSSRESLITSQTTRANPAFVEESGDESVTDASVVQISRVQTRAQGVRKKELELPRKQDPSPSVQETLESDEVSETEGSDYESMYTKDSVFTDQQSVAVVPTIAVMTDTPSPQLQPPVRFRTSVHPETNLPPIDLKQTSLVGRVVEEEGPIQQQLKSKADIERWRNKQRQRDKMQGESQTKPGNRPSFTEKKAWSRAQQEIGSVLDPEAMQPIVRKKKRKPRRKYNMKTETTDDEENVKLKSFHKLNSPREEKSVQREQESQSDSDISMGEARRRMIALLDDAFASMKSSSKKHSRENTDNVDGNQNPHNYSSAYPPPLYPRPATSAPALPEPPPAHGRATAPSARHRRRFLNSQNSLPYPSHYYPGTSGGYSPGYPPPPPPPVVTRNPVVVWDPADKQRLLNQSSYRPYPGHPYTYSDPSSKLHFTPVQRTPDGMGGLVWSPYATEYAMEDFYRNVGVPGTFDDKNSGFLSKMQETPLAAAPDANPAPRDTVIDVGGSGIANEPGTVTGQSAEPLVRAIKDELFRLSTGRTPVKHL